jgi:tetratricopeptide (TPR) repeat protein
MLYEHGMTTESQKILIDVVFSSGSSVDKSKALNLLAVIAIDKNNHRAALDSWNRLIKDYPESPEAKIAKDRITLLASVLGQVEDESINDATALMYLRSANFWSQFNNPILRMPWISTQDGAIYWLEKVIAEFPGSVAARVAYEEKMRRLLAVYPELPGGYSFPINHPQLEATFREYERAYPNASAAQIFRFMIAYAIWYRGTQLGDRVKARSWLNEIISKDGGTNSFYKYIAERALKMTEKQ